MQTKPSDEQLQELWDKQTIHEVLMSYCRAIDRNDIDAFEDAYWPDAWDDHGLFKGPVTELVKLNRDLKDGDDPHKMRWMTHNVCNEYVRIEGDVAYSEASFIGIHGCEKDGVEQLYLLGGRYVDRFERRDGVWKIADRVVVCDWESMAPDVEGLWSPSPWVKGVRSSKDPVYRHW